MTKLGWVLAHTFNQLTVLMLSNDPSCNFLEKNREHHHDPLDFPIIPNLLAFPSILICFLPVSMNTCAVRAHACSKPSPTRG